tara:strand:+ start:519 stop:806 length:288 start_codon:yes stop_codon:yes gene_type:complete
MKYEMGEMPKEEKMDQDELDLSGAEFENVEEEVEVSNLDDMVSKIAELEVEDLKSLEAAVASELEKREESEDEMAEVGEEAEEVAMEDDLSAMFS